MNGSHIASAGGGTALLAQVLMYLTHWPLGPMDQSTAMAFAGLIVMVAAGGGIGIWNGRKNGKGEPPAPKP